MPLTIAQIIERQKTCVWCGRSYSPASNVQKYCRQECKLAARAARDRRTTEEVACCHCGITYIRQLRPNSQLPACSRCRSEAGRSANFNGGLHLSDGRCRIYCRDGSFVYYYRAVMEAELKRPLLPDETVHHVNGDCSDDRIENLQLLDRATHGRIHGWERWT